MKLSVLALDYDGTIASGDTLDPSVREAIAAARARGILVLLVTGRILDELRRVAGDLHFVDGVVAENGALVHFPSSGHTSLLAPSIVPAYVEELQRRGISCHAGQCLVDADAADGARLLDVIRTLELPLVLLFNRSRLMTLPQGVSKATGLHAALDILRASARNTVAIGDAENDHELLRLAEVGMAVEWGSAALRAAADFVVHGASPADVGASVRHLADTGRIPVPERARRRLRLGYREDGREFSLAVRGRNILVTGDARSGKSWMAGLLCEQLILHGYSLCVIDPEGDYRSLEGLPGVSVLGGHNPPPSPCDLLEALHYPDRSVVIDLSRQRHDAKVAYVRAILPGLSAMRRRSGLPHRIVLDDAHHFLHNADTSPLIDLTFKGYVVVTYCASRLPKDLLGATEVVIATCESNALEVEGLRTMCGCGGCAHTDCACWCRRIGHLQPGQAAALPITTEAEGELRVFTMAPRLTPHVRQREKNADVPVPESRAFVFAANGQLSGRRANTLRDFVTGLEHATADMLAGHLRRGDFSRWIRDVFGDRALAAVLQALEERSRVDLDQDAVPDIVNAVRSRYDLTDDTSA
ncbi:MAG TPA: HAD hydrolase family protein [Vicinamibacterales bacterium]|nr:HAD hydrolase family protein [Vicinamibacterales bacterium]